MADLEEQSHFKNASHCQQLIHQGSEQQKLARMIEMTDFQILTRTSNTDQYEKPR